MPKTNGKMQKIIDVHAAAVGFNGIKEATFNALMMLFPASPFLKYQHGEKVLRRPVTWNINAGDHIYI